MANLSSVLQNVVGFILPDLRKIIVAFHGGNYLTLVGDVERVLPLDLPYCFWAQSVLFAPEAKLFCGYSNGHLVEWDVNNGGQVRRLEGHTATFGAGHTGRVESLALLPKGQFVSASADKTLVIWDIATGNKIHTLAGHKSKVICVVVLTDGSLVSGATNGTIHVWDVATGECTKVFRDREFLKCMAALGDGRLVTGGGLGLNLHVWDIHTGQKTVLLSALPSWTKHVTQCVLALADGRVLSAGEDVDGLAQVWDLTTGLYTTIVTGHHHSIITMAELPDGRVVSGALYEATPRVWDPSTGVNSGMNPTAPSAMGDENRDMVRSLVVLPDGRVVSGGVDEVRVWR